MADPGLSTNPGPSTDPGPSTNPIRTPDPVHTPDPVRTTDPVPKTEPGPTTVQRLRNLPDKMFSMSNNSKVPGYGLIILNVLRLFNISTLLLMGASSMVMMVKSDVRSGFFFFEAMAHFFSGSVAVFLVVSETSLFRRYFEVAWPVLSVNHSFAWLGTAMVVMGCQVLGYLNQDGDYTARLTLPLWRLVLASGILGLVFGLSNMVASLVWRDPANGITARGVRDEGALARSSRNPSAKASTYEPSEYGSTRPPTAESRLPPTAAAAAASRFDRATKVLSKFYPSKGIKKSMVSAPVIVRRDDDDLESARPATRESREVGDRVSPIAPNVMRPPTALHPAMYARSTRSSRYSVANMTQF